MDLNEGRIHAITGGSRHKPDHLHRFPPIARSRPSGSIEAATLIEVSRPVKQGMSLNVPKSESRTSGTS